MSDLPEIDPNKIAAEFLQANIERAVALGAKQFSGVRNRFRLSLERTYGSYVRRLLERHSRAKSFFVRSEPLPLYDFFVPLDLATPRQRIESAGASEIAAVARHAIIAGTGGSGKSMVMRHLLVSALRSREKTPIFLELRSIEGSLEDALLNSLNVNGLEVDGEYFHLALKAGHFSLLLDGFDELDRRARAKLGASVQALVEKYPQNWVILSSRPDIELQGWAAFTLFELQPLNLAKAIALVQRLPFESGVKDRFVNDLRRELFARHQSFLSNPLLLSIMLLTYNDTAQIPNKLSIFYNQAYESLFQKHDALKGGFQRPRSTTLDIQDFAKVFAAFCVRTYSKRQFTFPATTALAELERCREITRLDFNAADFLADAQQAVCLLIEEGTDLGFAHRSFQEYFAAVFVAMAPPLIKEQLIEKFSPAVGSDEVMRLLYEIDPYAVETYYLLPHLQRLRSKIKVVRRAGVSHYKRYLNMLFSTLQLSTAEDSWVVTIKDTALLNAVVFAKRHVMRGVVPDIEDEGPSDPIAGTLKAQFNRGEFVPIRSFIEDRSRFSVLQRSDGILGMRFLEAVLEVEKKMRLQHAATGGSLDSILK